MNFILGLGSNLEPRKTYLQQAARLLVEHKIRIEKKSFIYETEPVGDITQPWFLNCVLQVEGDVKPPTLLNITQKIEFQLGRRRPFCNAPRTIDIDLLLAEDLVIYTEHLVIPHPRLAERKFVLLPLVEIAPQVIHPVYHKSIGQLYQELSDDSKVIKLEPFEF
ncbi:MAG: 2-amino-4-hydroxy-6-hydroxymethyldihydropteridine diphosphokinase [Candidatus Aminicenantes bacterium 4484_214]|nr:MAG: 2-amino-4-hydroxy-6-hydroxymethyldihydropteridine diphosphokinase [Candidatus Aminicenantes bacterium 4484_214]RLE07459.1 MAG: 2-amino-4-hydroxy-6-hydroxymethyldihydropteridine diphosphokinase [Candidatus Aminicenantes bacterium]